MDGSGWKRVLVHWVNQSRFFERTFYNLEQTDIEEFFEKFRGRITSSRIEHDNLILFLKEQYPEFELNLDDDNHLSFADYMYVYSLLLHFSCVKYPDELFHKICQGLQEPFQQAIATFFKVLLEKDALNKTNVRQAIAEASPKPMLLCLQIDSPNKTPGKNRISPPTPKTNMLEEKTRELNSTRAQLDTERYEKGLLEVQLKQHEDKITKLTQVQRKYIAEIHSLKNELLVKTTENNSPTKNMMDEQIKKRLRKEIAEKEEIILGLRENLESLKEEKILLAEKLCYSEKQVITCLEKIKEMDYTVNDLKSEIEQRDITIKVLTETKNDLEQFIEETRSSPGYQTAFNMSAECLDGSISRTTNSSGSLLSSPENLGCSVIDIQLKEKEIENANLREEIDKLKCDQNKLTKHVFDSMIRYSDVFDICNENMIATEEATFTETFLIFENYISSLVEKYKVSSNNVKQLTEETDTLSSSNKDLSNRLREIEENLLIYKNQIKLVEEEKINLEKENNILQNKHENFMQELEKLKDDRESILATVESLKKDYVELENQKKLSEQSFSDQVQKLSLDLSEKCKEIENVEIMNKELKEKIQDMLQNISNLEQSLGQMEDLQKDTYIKNTTLENESKNLSAEITELRNKLQQHQQEEEILKTKHDNLLQEHEKIQISAREVKEYLDKMKEDYEIKTNNLQQLEVEMSTLNDDNVQLRNQINDLTARNTSLEENHLKLNNEMSTLKGDNCKKNNQILQLTDEVAKLRSENEMAIQKNEEEKCAQTLLIDKLRKNLEDAGDNVRHFTEMSNKLENALTSLQEENKKLSETIVNKEEECKKFSQLVHTLESEKYSLEENIQQMKEDLEEKITILTLNDESYKNELYSLLQKLDDNVDEEICCEFVAFFDTDYSDSTMNEFQKKLNILLNNNMELNRKNSELIGTVTNLETSLEKVTDSKDKLIQKLNRSQGEIEQLDSERRELEASKSEYMNRVEELQKNIHDLEIQCNCLSSTNSELSALSSVLENELQNIVQENMNLLMKVGDLESEIEMTAERCSNLQYELNFSKSEMDKLKSSTESTANALRQRIILLEENQESREKEVSSLRKHYEHNCEIIQNLESEKNEFVHQIKSQLENLQGKESYISSLESENVRLKLKLDDVSMVFSEKEKRYKEKLHDINEKVRNLENEVQRVESSKMDLQIDFKKNEGAFMCTRKEIVELKHKIEELTVTNKNLKVENENLFHKLKASNIELESKEMKFTTIKANLKKLEEEKSKDAKKLRQSEDEISTLKRKILNQVVQFESLKGEKDELINENNSLSQEICSFADESRNKQEEVKQLNTTVEQLLEQIQSLKESLISVENDSKYQKTLCQKLQQDIQITKSENEKLKENQSKLEEVSSNYNKRLEKVSIKLGESQGKVSKLEKEKDSILKDLESSKKMSENLQRDILKYQNDNKTLKEKLTSLQKTCDELNTQKHGLEKNAVLLKKQTETLHESERNLKQEIEQLEKDKKDLDIKVKRLSGTLLEMTGALDCAKSENINLDKRNAMFTLELNELKKNLETYKQNDVNQRAEIKLSEELEVKCQELSENLIQLQNENAYLREIDEQLRKEAGDISEENSKLTEELANVSSRFQLIQEEHAILGNRLIELNEIVHRLRSEKEILEQKNIDTSKKLKQLELREMEILEAEGLSHRKVDEATKELDSLLQEKICETNVLREKIEELKIKDEKRMKELSDKSETLNELKIKFEAIEEQFKDEQALTGTLQKDISILKAKLYKNRQISEENEKKWLDERQKLISESKLAEERIKDNRLELEGKLEKMKTKMKSIYNEEVTKIRNKHERDMGELRMEFHTLMAKNEKYESHVQKLSRQIYQLNDTILELQKENKFMETKLKDYESCSSMFRKHHPSSSQVLGSDLRMEDEPGEIFNNTYLTDMKNGRISPFGRESVSAHELQYRNSLAPPHLRSTYSAQYLDQHLREDEIKDGIPMNLDDSLSSLLYSGQRKKLSGTTSYKKPGPPTPSKNAGRLSFGGCIDTHPREILKETNASGVPLKKSTPNKLKTFFSSKSSRDEFSSPGDRKRSLRNRKSISRPLSAQFTSTPRKSRVHFDQRRQLDLYLKTGKSDNTTSNEHSLLSNRLPCIKLSNDGKEQRKSENNVCWREPCYYATESESNSSCAEKTNNKCTLRNLHKKRIISKDRRVSFFYRGNVYNSRSKIPSKIMREQYRKKSKNERIANFNKFRNSLCVVHLRESLLSKVNSGANTENSFEFTGKELECAANINKNNFDYEQNNNSQQFEVLVKEKESQAPFDVTELNFAAESQSSLFGDQCTMATSKTLYAGSVIVNRKIPYVNSTMVRKTSFFVVSNKNVKSIVELANERITLIDLCRMWGQMSYATKLVLFFGFCIFLTQLIFTYVHI